MLKIFTRVFFCSNVPILVLQWCIHMMCIAYGSTRALFNSKGMFGSSYVRVSIGMCIITCVSGKRPMYGVEF